MKNAMEVTVSLSGVVFYEMTRISWFIKRVLLFLNSIQETAPNVHEDSFTSYGILDFGEDCFIFLAI
ncbi:MAG TPA: hypothetical protein PKG85_03585 [Mesotoga infera]|jgi:hypothetical protein|uniref:hypothetical protein n=1 Tax=unclassified Mesotoga TaxID=1184398 RepID=UPI000DC00694|nr:MULTISPECIES: hypothetical protein [unclassified Mesotoga]RAM58466.1 hypothetical protein DS66_09380 [Mesotoga sp. SC_3PWM13N19]RAM59355.1 hypothetical protein DS67_02825 [Mesotoga sp. SC_4PWA21]HNR79301.1 hypothetical protein [Mesotoga infera]